MDLRAFALRPRRDPSAAWVQCNTQHVVRVIREEALRVRLGVKHDAKPRSVVHQLASRRADEVVAAVMAAVSVHILELELVRRRRHALGHSQCRPDLSCALRRRLGGWSQYDGTADERWKRRIDPKPGLHGGVLRTLPWVNLHNLGRLRCVPPLHRAQVHPSNRHKVPIAAREPHARHVG